jgi:hypothetical protein
MGYTFYPDYKVSQLVAHLIADVHVRDGVVMKTIAHKKVGKNLWRVDARYENDVETSRELSVAEIDRYHDGAGYRSCSESCGPNQEDCPLEFFDLVPTPPNDTARAFRERCRAAQARIPTPAAIKTLRPGDRITLPPGFRVSEFTYIRTEKRTVVAIGTADGKTYRLRPSIMRQATIGTPTPTAAAPVDLRLIPASA